MAGIIDGSITTPKDPLDATTSADPLMPAPIGAETTPKAASYDATLGAVNPATDSVSGQMDTLLSKDNPYIERARAKAAEVANSRGLLNSSMAAGAGEAAAIDAALPIASQDAGTYSQQRLANQGASNTAGQFNAGAQNQFGLQAAGGEIASRSAEQQARLQTGLIGTQTEAASRLAAQQGEIQMNLQSLRGDQATAVAQIEANYKQLMQTSASASTMFADVSKTIGAIMNDVNTTAEQKQAAVNNQIALLNASLAVLGGVNNLDLGSLLDFSSLTNVIPPPPPPPPPPPLPPPVGSEGDNAAAQTGGA
jgi:hypothetical protein